MAISFKIICALMKVKLSVTVRSGYRFQNVESIDQIVNAIKQNPFYFFDIKITDMTSTLFPDFHNLSDNVCEDVLHVRRSIR